MVSAIKYRKDLTTDKTIKIIVNATAIYDCSLERAFKSPILCDISKVHTGYWFMPRVTHCTDEGAWGQKGSSKNVYFAKSLWQKGGFGSVDHVLERIENQYWKIEVTDFQAWLFGFHKFAGEWKTTEVDKNKIRIEYRYSLYFKNPLLYPVCWLFAKVFWKKYMHHILENVRHLVMTEEPYRHK